MDYQPQPQPTTDLFQTEPIVYGTFWERFAAVLIDIIILLVPSFLLSYFLSETSSNLAGIVLFWLYDAVQESGPAQATIGKKALGLIVTDLEDQPISFGRATGRHFGKYISGAILLIGYFMMLWSDRKQALHDMIAGTLIVKGKS
jgi:uncharacterized RDD family membrane protein YckC